jgi:hypothetical protein
MSHKGKATSDVNYNPEDGPEAYSNLMVHTRLSAYTTMAREVHGPEFDPATEDLDGEVFMRVGGGKNHGRYWIAEAQSTRPLLLLYLRLEQGARVRAQAYNLGKTLHGTGYRHSRSFLLYLSFIDYCIPFLCIIITLE